VLLMMKMTMMMRMKMHCRYGGGTKLLNCRNAACLTAAKLAAKHGHVACVQLLNALKKHGVGGGAAGDSKPSVHETPPVAAVQSDDAGDDAGGGGGTGQEPSDAIVVAVVKPPTAVVHDAAAGDRASAVLAPAVSVLPEIFETRDKDRSAAARAVKTPTAATITVTEQSTRRCKSALPAARYGKRTAV